MQELTATQQMACWYGLLRVTTATPFRDVIYAAADMLGPLLDANLVLDHC